MESKKELLLRLLSEGKITPEEMLTLAESDHSTTVINNQPPIFEPRYIPQQPLIPQPMTPWPYFRQNEYICGNESGATCKAFEYQLGKT